MKFKFLTGDVNWQTYGGKFISKRFNNGEFDYWLVMEIINWEDATGEKPEGNIYNVSLSVVSPEQAGKAGLESAFNCCGMDDQDCQKNPIVQVGCLHGYGIHTPVFSESGSNLAKLMKQAREEADKITMLFGFYMDRPVNRIGTTGWECVKGDMDSGPQRTIASGTTEGNILAKMHGIPV